MTEFIIVVEVDNVRAHAAFSKGYAEMIELWPAIQARCAAVEVADRKVGDRRIKQSETYIAELRARMDGMKCDAEMRAIKNAISHEEIQIAVIRAFEYNLEEPFKSALERMKKLAALSGVAISAFRVKEDDAELMVALDDGSYIASLKEMLASPIADCFDEPGGA